MHVDIADQREFDLRAAAFRLLAELADARGLGDPGVRQIEHQLIVEHQREGVIAQRGGDAGAVRKLEHIAHECRLHRRPHPHRRLPLLGLLGTLLAQRPLGGAGPFGEFAHHVLRQSRRRAFPAVGKQIDEQPLAGHHRIHSHLAGQRQADRGAVGITPHRTDVTRRRHRQPVHRHVDRTLETDDEDRARKRDLGIDILIQFQHKPRKAVGGGQRRLAMNGLGTRGLARHGDDQRRARASGNDPPNADSPP